MIERSNDPGRGSRAARSLFAAAVSLVLLSLSAPALAVDTVTYTEDTQLVLSGLPAVSLTILAGSSHGDSLLISASDFTLPSSITGTFTVRYWGSPAKAFTDGVTDYCAYVGGNNDFVFTSAHVNKTISISATDCAAPPSGGGGGGGYTAPYGTLSAPNGGQTINAGSSYQIMWSAGGTGVTGIKLSLSTDGGATYPTVITANTSNSSYYYWTIPDVSTSQAKIKMEVLGTTLTDTSDAVFTIAGTAVIPPVVPTTPVVEPTTPTVEPTTPTGTTTPTAAPLSSTADFAALEAAAPATDSNTSGAYDATAAAENTPTINVDKELEEPPVDKSSLCEAGSLIKGSQPAVYYCGKNGKRYVFTSEKAYLTWYADFSGVKTITDTVLAQIPLAGNVTYRPGVRMVKIQTDPKVYAIARGGILRWVENENAARILYGLEWNKKIDDVSDAFFVNYVMGPPITETEAAGGVTL